MLAANIHLPEQSTYNSEDKRRVAIDKLARRLAEIPNAEHTGICSTAPLFGYSKELPIQVQGQTSDDPTKQPTAGYTMISVGLLRDPRHPAAGRPAVFRPNSRQTARR